MGKKKQFERINPKMIKRVTNIPKVKSIQKKLSTHKP